MTVIDSRVSRRVPPSARTAALAPVEPGLSGVSTLRLSLGLVAVGVVAGIATDAPDGATLKLCFVAACVLGPVLGRPSALRAVLRSLPLAWVVGLFVAQALTAPHFTVRDAGLNTGTAIVLLAPWLWGGWFTALAITFARGGLRKR